MGTFKVSYTYAWYSNSQMFWIYSSNFAPPPSLGASRGRERWQNMLTTFYSKLISSLGGENKYELFLSKISTLL